MKKEPKIEAPTSSTVSNGSGKEAVIASIPSFRVEPAKSVTAGLLLGLESEEAANIARRLVTDLTHASPLLLKTISLCLTALTTNMSNTSDDAQSALDAPQLLRIAFYMVENPRRPFTGAVDTLADTVRREANDRLQDYEITTGSSGPCDAD